MRNVEQIKNGKGRTARLLTFSALDIRERKAERGSDREKLPFVE